MADNPQRTETQTAKAWFAGGCFWGVEHLFRQKEGVISTTSGYMGGHSNNPTYQDVCTGKTGHLEVVELEYDPDRVTYDELTKFLFEIHDPTQTDGQGPDIGEQYQSAVFYGNEEEKKTVNRLIDVLKSKGHDVVTKALPVAPFWKAEEYHQQYYDRNQKRPYCHVYRKKF